MVQGQLSTVGVLEHLKQAVPISDGSVNRRELWHCPDGKRHPPEWSMPNVFHRLQALIDQTCKCASLNSV